MPRAKNSPASRRRRKAYLKQAKGYVERGLHYAYRDRRRKKRDFRRLWIIRINAAARRHDMSYSQLIHELDTSGIALNRKVLADLAVRDEQAFADVIETARVGSK